MKTKTYFTDKAFHNMGEHETLKACDSKTGINLTFSFNSGGYLGFEFPDQEPLLMQVDGDEVNRVATLICAGYSPK